MSEKHTCCICGREFEGDGNNPEPVKPFDEGVCCDECNFNAVIPKRLKSLNRKSSKMKYFHY